MEMETAREASEKFLRKLHREKINTYFEVTMFQTVGYGSIPIDTFLVGWTSINPSYFDVHYRGTRFWHTASSSQQYSSELVQTADLMSNSNRLASLNFEIQASNVLKACPNFGSANDDFVGLQFWDIPKYPNGDLYGCVWKWGVPYNYAKMAIKCKTYQEISSWGILWNTTSIA